MHLASGRLAAAAAIIVLVASYPLARAGDEPRLLDTVPDVAQSTDYSCGCSALEAVLAYWGVALSEKEIIEEAKVDPEVGAEMEHLAAIAVKRGLKALVKEKLGLKDLLAELKKGRPVIALIQAWRDEDATGSWKDEWDAGHYVVVIGIDREFVYLEDPSLEETRGKIPHAEFVERWHCYTIDGRATTGQAILIGGRRPAADRKRGPRMIEPVK